MPDFLDDFEQQRRASADEIRRRGEAEERQKLKEEKKKLDQQHQVEQAKEKAVAERKKTLDWAWVASTLLRDSKVQPEHWIYNYQQRRRLFGFTAMQGIAAEGWPLLDWQNEHYWPVLRHTLLLTPRDDDNSGNHLRFFSQPSQGNKALAVELKPSDVHKIPSEPLSKDDMPWPGRISADGKGRTMIEAILERDMFHATVEPWGKSFSLTIDEFDSHKEYVDLFSKLEEEAGIPEAERKAYTPKEHDYKDYQEAGIEISIRRAIAHVAATHLDIAPEKIALTIKRRTELGIE